MNVAAPSVTVDRDRLVENAGRMIDVWSFTGDEQRMAELMVELYRALGLRVQWQQVEDQRANALGTCGTNVRVLSDLFHMNIEEADIAAALREAGKLVGHIHFADSNRHAIGFGHTGVASVVAALRDIGYTGYLSAEILPLPDSVTAARRTIESFREHTRGGKNSKFQEPNSK